MTPSTHVLVTAHRTAVLKVTEQPDVIDLALQFSKTGFFGDESEIAQWLQPIFDSYEKDRRPFRMRNALSGEVAVVGDNCALIRQQTHQEAKRQ